MNLKLDEIGIALAHAKNELNSLIVEFIEEANTQMHEVYLIDIGRKAVEIRGLEIKWDDAEYAEFTSHSDEDDHNSEDSVSDDEWYESDGPDLSAEGIKRMWGNHD